MPQQFIQHFKLKQKWPEDIVWESQINTILWATPSNSWYVSLWIKVMDQLTNRPALPSLGSTNIALKLRMHHFLNILNFFFQNSILPWSTWKLVSYHTFFSKMSSSTCDKATKLVLLLLSYAGLWFSCYEMVGGNLFTFLQHRRAHIKPITKKSPIMTL